jgi:hypothetical protein
MLVLPGPGIIVIIAGLALLAREFIWAERALNYTKSKASSGTKALRRVARVPRAAAAAGREPLGRIAAPVHSDSDTGAKSEDP